MINEEKSFCIDIRYTVGLMRVGELLNILQHVTDTDNANEI